MPQIREGSRSQETGKPVRIEDCVQLCKRDEKGLHYKVAKQIGQRDAVLIVRGMWRTVKSLNQTEEEYFFYAS